MTLDLDINVKENDKFREGFDGAPVVGVKQIGPLDVGGFAIPEYDYISLTYVAAGDGQGEIETATFKTGGSGGTTVATLTLTYNANDEIATVTKT